MARQFWYSIIEYADNGGGGGGGGGGLELCASIIQKKGKGNVLPCHQAKNVKQ